MKRDKEIEDQTIQFLSIQKNLNSEIQRLKDEREQISKLMADDSELKQIEFNNIRLETIKNEKKNLTERISLLENNIKNIDDKSQFQYYNDEKQKIEDRIKELENNKKLPIDNLDKFNNEIKDKNDLSPIEIDTINNQRKFDRGYSNEERLNLKISQRDWDTIALLPE